MLQTASKPPSSPRSSATAASVADQSLRSTVTAVRVPSPSSDRSVSARPSPFRSSRPTCAPSAAASCANERAMPDAAPVIRMRRPVSEKLWSMMAFRVGSGRRRSRLAGLREGVEQPGGARVGARSRPSRAPWRGRAWRGWSRPPPRWRGRGARSRAPPSGTTSVTRPAAAAATASSRRPSSTSSFARPSPTTRASRWWPPQVGRRSRPTSGRPNVAEAPATRASQASASSRPPPRQKPSIAATTRHGWSSSSAISAWPSAWTASAVGRVERAELLHVLAGAERLLAAADEHDRAHRGVGGGLLQLAAQPGDGGPIERVSPLGPVDPQFRDATHGSPYTLRAVSFRSARFDSGFRPSSSSCLMHSAWRTSG